MERGKAVMKEITGKERREKQKKNESKRKKEGKRMNEKSEKMKREREKERERENIFWYENRHDFSQRGCRGIFVRSPKCFISFLENCKWHP